MRLPRPAVIVPAAALAAAWLSGCAMSDDKLARVLVAPGKYSTYRCVDMAERAKVIGTRQAELKALMVQAGPSAGGQFVSATAYRPEYLNLHGEMMDLQQAARDKKCGFVPGADTSAAPAGATPLPPPPARR